MGSGSEDTGQRALRSIGECRNTLSIDVTEGVALSAIKKAERNSPGAAAGRGVVLTITLPMSMSMHTGVRGKKNNVRIEPII